MDIIALRLLLPGVAETEAGLEDSAKDVSDLPTDAEAESRFLNRLGPSFLLRNLAALEGASNPVKTTFSKGIVMKLFVLIWKKASVTR